MALTREAVLNHVASLEQQIATYEDRAYYHHRVEGSCFIYGKKEWNDTTFEKFLRNKVDKGSFKEFLLRKLDEARLGYKNATIRADRNVAAYAKLKEDVRLQAEERRELFRNKYTDRRM